MNRFRTKSHQTLAQKALLVAKTALGPYNFAFCTFNLHS